MIYFATLSLQYPCCFDNMQEAITEVHLELLQFSQIVPIAIKNEVGQDIS